jgi:hypothetical protein
VRSAPNQTVDSSMIMPMAIATGSQAEIQDRRPRLLWDNSTLLTIEATSGRQLDPQMPQSDPTP